jgi:hypothetical protein
MSPKLVEIHWLDSRGGADRWEDTDDLEPLEPAHCTSVGFLIDDTPAYKTLVQTVSQDQVLGRITIPVRAVVRQRVLGQARRPRKG